MTEKENIKILMDTKTQQARRNSCRKNGYRHYKLSICISYIIIPRKHRNKTLLTNMFMHEFIE